MPCVLWQCTVPRLLHSQAVSCLTCSATYLLLLCWRGCLHPASMVCLQCAGSCLSLPSPGRLPHAGMPEFKAALRKGALAMWWWCKTALAGRQTGSKGRVGPTRRAGLRPAASVTPDSLSRTRTNTEALRGSEFISAFVQLQFRGGRRQGCGGRAPGQRPGGTGRDAAAASCAAVLAPIAASWRAFCLEMKLMVAPSYNGTH